MGAKKMLTLSASLAVAALALTGCGATASESTDSSSAVETGSLDALITAAQAEGSLTVYGEIQEPDMLRFAEGFKEKYGIEAKTLRLGGNSLAQRLDAELSAGGDTADAIIGVDLEFFKDVVDQGDLVSFEDSGVEALLEGFPAEFNLTDFGVPMLQTLATGSIYNTDNVQASDIPKTWDDLIDNDRWAGKYCAVDPSTAASVVQFFSVARAAAGDDFLSEFSENVGRWYPNVVAMNEAVAVGECDLGINSAQFFVEGMKAAASAPVGYAAEASTIYPLVTTAVTTKAKSPNAARLFMHYILSEEGNHLLNNPAGGSFGPWDGAEIPEGFWTPTPEDYQNWRDESPEILTGLGF